MKSASVFSPRKKKKRPVHRPTLYVANRFSEFKWMSNKWIIPPTAYEDDVTILIEVAFGSLLAALKEDEIRVRQSVLRLLNHQKLRVARLVCLEIKGLSPSPKGGEGMSLRAAQLRIAGIIKTLFRDMHATLRDSRITESSSHALIVLHLTITEEQIADGIMEYMGEWK